MKKESKETKADERKETPKQQAMEAEQGKEQHAPNQLSDKSKGLRRSKQIKDPFKLADTVARLKGKKAGAMGGKC